MTYSDSQPVISKMIEVYNELFKHDGFGNMSVEIKILKKGQKEVIIYCGKQYRFVVDYNPKAYREEVTYSMKKS
ncbi:MAG: hypothetical protein MJA31_06670 [Clostridia bacterium]|nr:hypothetical protein [Clostridia bacterium]